jgi:hypothetical protein
LALLASMAVAASARADVYDDNLAAASRGPGDIVVLARGVDGAIYERHLAGGAWSSWSSIGGAASSGPAAAAYGDAIHAFVTGTDGPVYENVLRGGAWSGWRSLGGVGTSAPAAIARRATRAASSAPARRARQAGRGIALYAAGRPPARHAEDPQTPRPRQAARAQGGLLRQARAAPHGPARPVRPAPADAVRGWSGRPRLRARDVHAQGLAQGTAQDGVAALRDVRVAAHAGTPRAVAAR